VTAAALANAAGSPRRLLPYQRRFVQDRSPIRCWDKGRRVGGTAAVAFKVVSTRLTGERPRDYFFSSADESAAREFIDECKRWCAVFNAAVQFVTGEEIIDGRSFCVYMIQFPECASGHAPKVVAMTSNPKRFRSKGGDVGLDEFAFHEDAEAMLAAAIPVTTWGGTIDILSTHNGENSKFNEIVQMGLRRSDPEQHGAPKPDDLVVSLHRTTIVDAIEDGLVEKINEVAGTNYTRESFLEEIRAKTPKSAFMQEYMCVPSSDESSYFPYADLRPLVSAEDPVTTGDLGRFLLDVRESVKRLGAARLFAGCDIGRKNDRFVLDVCAAHGSTLRGCGMLVLDRQPFQAMRHAIDGLMALCRDTVPMSRLCIDETGLGMQLAEEAEDRYGRRVEKVSFSNTVKEDLATAVRVRVDERTMSLPDDAEVIGDFASIRKTVTSAGNLRFDAEANESGHADRFWARALTVHAHGSKKSRARMVGVELGGVPV